MRGPGRSGTRAALAAAVAAAVAPGEASAVVGDFNGDGRADLAAGVPLESTSGAPLSGSVRVVYAGRKKLKPSTGKALSLATKGVRGNPEQPDRFGSALASGDFNGDGRADLAVGAPGRTVGGEAIAGAVYVFTGRRKGLRGKGTKVYSQNKKGIKGVAEQSDWFGSALASGDFNGDRRDDLAIGASLQDLAPAASQSCNPNLGEDSNAGGVNVLYGSGKGLKVGGDQFLSQGSGAESADCFGAALAAGDFTDDGRDELAVGVAFEDQSAITNAGEVDVFKGRKKGLREGVVRIVPGADAPGVAEANDVFGASLATGDLNGDGVTDLVVGAPGETVGAQNRAGAVVFLAGGQPDPGIGSGVGEQLTESSIGGSAEALDFFGTELAVGRFGKGKRKDVAIGVPHEDLSTFTRPGQVLVANGDATGIANVSAQLLTFAVLGLGVADEDRVGQHLSAARFGKDKLDDLAIGVPLREVDAADAAGAVALVYARKGGLSVPTVQLLTEATPGIPGDPGGRLGSAVAP